MEQGYFRKPLIGFSGNGFTTDAIIIKRNPQTVRIAIYNIRETRFELRNVKPEMVTDREDRSMIDLNWEEYQANITKRQAQPWYSGGGDANDPGNANDLDTFYSGVEK